MSSAVATIAAAVMGPMPGAVRSNATVAFLTRQRLDPAIGGDDLLVQRPEHMKQRRELVG